MTAETMRADGLRRTADLMLQAADILRERELGDARRRCPRCDRAADNRSRFCFMCGTRLGATPTAGEPCLKCGEQRVIEGLGLCMACGTLDRGEPSEGELREAFEAGAKWREELERWRATAGRTGAPPQWVNQAWEAWRAARTPTDSPTGEAVAMPVDLRTIHAMLDEVDVPHGRSSDGDAPMTPEGRIRWLVEAYRRAIGSSGSDVPRET